MLTTTTITARTATRACQSVTLANVFRDAQDDVDVAIVVAVPVFFFFFVFLLYFHKTTKSRQHFSEHSIGLFTRIIFE